MDNRIFNVNGKGLKQLAKTLELLIDNHKVKGWRIDKEKGFILYAYISKKETVSPFPTPMSAEWLAPLIMQWLDSDEAKEMKCINWDADQDHDGSNEYGFRVYTEDWGRVNDEWGSIGAVRPAYLWYGK